MNLDALRTIIFSVNNILSTVFAPAIFFVALAYILIRLFLQWRKSQGVFGAIFLMVQTLVPIGIWLFLWYGTILLDNFAKGSLLASLTSFLRWGLLWSPVFLFVLLYSKEHGENRGIYSAIHHFLVFSLGWYLGRWFGLAFITMPILAAYYNTMYYSAQGILPTTDPENKVEKWQKFRVLLWYTWGMQYPIQVVDEKDPSGRKVDTRIPGSPFTGFSYPGIVWIKSHQAAALTKSINFSRIEGPRVIYTQPSEQLLEVVDLRTQLRSSSIDAVTKDGVRFKATVFASFGLDREEWPVEIYSQLFHKNNILLHGKKPDANLDGIFSFSRPRVHAALTMRGKTSATPEEQKPIYWDDRVMNQIEIAATHILSDRKFDDLWHPSHDGPGVSALDEIADKLKERVFTKLLSQGVRLYAARVVEFDFPEYKGTQVEKDKADDKDSSSEKANRVYDDVVNRQIASWKIDWVSRRSQILADAEAESHRLQQEARAYAQSVLLTAFAESFQQTRELYPNIPPHVIAEHFMEALEQLTSDQPYGGYQYE